jgi:hypothetical protein
MTNVASTPRNCVRKSEIIRKVDNILLSKSTVQSYSPQICTDLKRTQNHACNPGGRPICTELKKKAMSVKSETIQQLSRECQTVGLHQFQRSHQNQFPSISTKPVSPWSNERSIRSLKSSSDTATTLRSRVPQSYINHGHAITVSSQSLTFVCTQQLVFFIIIISKQSSFVPQL